MRYVARVRLGDLPPPGFAVPESASGAGEHAPTCVFLFLFLSICVFLSLMDLFVARFYVQFHESR